MVAARFISAKLKFQGKLAVAAIAVSFFVIIVAVAVSQGFRNEIRSGVAAISGDILITQYVGGSDDPVPMSAHLPQEEQILSIPGVSALRPVVSRAGIVKSGDIIHGVVVKGSTDLSLGPLQVSIPRRLADITGASAGDALTVYFIGSSVKVRKFTVAAVHTDILEADDNLVIHAPLEDMQRLCGWGPESVTSVEAGLHPMFRGRAMQEEISARIGDALGEEYYVASSARTYPQLYDWLDLLDSNVLFILVLMTMVAGFNMVSGLFIVLMRNVRLTGMLKTMGMADREIGRVFVRLASGAALKGMLIGNAFAIVFCLVQGTTHLIPLDPANYFIAYVPVYVPVLRILACDAIAYLCIVALTWLPVRLVARIDPAATVKAD